MIKKLFAPGHNSGAANLGLLVLRLWIGFSMLLNHGVEKLNSFSDTAPNFPDPLGIGHTASLALAAGAAYDPPEAGRGVLLAGNVWRGLESAALVRRIFICLAPLPGLLRSALSKNFCFEAKLAPTRWHTTVP